MQDYATTDSCRMLFLTRQLDDAVCDGVRRVRRVCGATVPAHSIPPRSRPARRSSARASSRSSPQDVGRATASRRRSGSSRVEHSARGATAAGARLVMSGKRQGTGFDDRLVSAAVDMIHEWAPDPRPTWVTFVPSLRHPVLGRRPSSADRRCTRPAGSRRGPQGSGHSSAEGRCRTAPTSTPTSTARSKSSASSLRARCSCVDDLVDSRWTLTEVAKRLRLAGAGPVFPLALASTMGRDS